MKLYFSPLACSLATRIVAYEARADVTFVEVDAKTKTAEDGRNFLDVHPLGLVPALELEPGVVLTENAAILQLLASLHPEARLAPEDLLGRARLQQWLCFVGTELHKAVYVPLLDETAPEQARAYALGKVTTRLDYLAKHLAGRQFLLDSFSVADGYLCAVLNWSAVTPVELGRWPAIAAYHARLRDRPAVRRAFGEEWALYQREQERLQASETAGISANFRDARAS